MSVQIYLQAHEYHLMTGRQVRMWIEGENGNDSFYPADATDMRPAEQQQPPEAAEDIGVENMSADFEDMPDSPTVHEVVVETDTDAPNDGSSADGCRICGATEDNGYWVGCSWNNPITLRQSCPYWVHSICIGLYITTERQLQQLPFFCPTHIKLVNKN